LCTQSEPTTAVAKGDNGDGLNPLYRISRRTSAEEKEEEMKRKILAYRGRSMDEDFVTDQEPDATSKGRRKYIDNIGPSGYVNNELDRRSGFADPAPAEDYQYGYRHKI